MNRRDFLKSLTAGAACVVLPATALDLINSADASSDSADEWGFLTVEHSWLGFGRTKVELCGGNKPHVVVTLSNNLGPIYRCAMAVGETHVINDSGYSLPPPAEMQVTIQDGKSTKRIDLASHIKGEYSPGESTLVVVDLNKIDEVQS